MLANYREELSARRAAYKVEATKRLEKAREYYKQKFDAQMQMTANAYEADDEMFEAGLQDEEAQFVQNLDESLAVLAVANSE